MQQAMTPSTILRTSWRYALVCGLLGLVFFEPALANKFETIGGGVSGSSGIKRTWLQGFFMVLGGASLLGSVLSIFVPHRNAAYLNYGNWKQSAAILFVFAVVFFGSAALI
jgi:hypothetical protein